MSNRARIILTTIALAGLWLPIFALLYLYRWH